MGGAEVIELFNIAIDEQVELEDRYAAIRIMQVMQREQPRNYQKLQQKALRQCRYNAKRGDYRSYRKEA